MFMDFDYFMRDLNKYKRIIVIIIALHLSLLIVAFYFWRMNFLFDLSGNYPFGILLMFLGLSMHTVIIVYSRRYFVLGKKFIILCPDFYLNLIFTIALLLLVSGFFIAVAYVFLSAIVSLLLFGLLSILALIDLVLYHTTKGVIKRMRNAKVTSNISCDELCNAIRFLISPQIAVSWNSSETLSEIAWRFRKRNKDFHKIFSIDRKLKGIFDELDSLMDPEFFNKTSNSLMGP